MFFCVLALVLWSMNDSGNPVFEMQLDLPSATMHLLPTAAFLCTRGFVLPRGEIQIFKLFFRAQTVSYRNCTVNSDHEHCTVFFFSHMHPLPLRCICHFGIMNVWNLRSETTCLPSPPFFFFFFLYQRASWTGFTVLDYKAP